MKIISCASYYSTGSSALTDLVSEYSSVKSFGDYEFSFLHDPDGLRDLYYHLVENPNRNNSGLALKRFLKLCKFLAGPWYKKGYDDFFDGQFYKCTEEYVSSLATTVYKGYFDFDLYDKGYFHLTLRRKIIRKLHLTKATILHKEVMYCPVIKKDEFIDKTHTYLANLFKKFDSNYEFTMVDQLVPSSGIAQVLEFIPNETKVIVVDRDPRDCYLVCKYVNKFDRLFPRDDIKAFCDWYKFARNCVSEEDKKNSSVLYLNFEDFIYCYEETKNKIEKFVGLKKEDHVRQFECLNPKKSVINTQIWTKYPKETENIKYIEENLKEYLYDFSKYDKNNVVGIEVKNDKIF